MHAFESFPVWAAIAIIGGASGLGFGYQFFGWAGVVAAAVGWALYFCPAFVAYANHRRNRQAIGWLNLLLGWTLLGWVGALVWANVLDSPQPAA